MESEFSKIPFTYVADGHHRTAAAYNVGKLRRDRKLNKKGFVDGDEEFNYFMSILYPSDALTIMPYNRVIKTLNGMTNEQFIAKIKEQKINVEPLKKG